MSQLKQLRREQSIDMARPITKWFNLGMITVDRYAIVLVYQ